MKVRKFRAFGAGRVVVAAAGGLLLVACLCAPLFGQETAAEPEEQADPAALKAIDLYVEGDVEGAYALFKEVHDANPDSDPPGVLLALLHSHAGRFLEMRRSLEQTAEDYPGDPEAYLQLAGIDVREGRFLEADLLLERADALVAAYKEAHPESDSRVAYFKGEALSIRANLAEKKGKFDAAVELVKKAVELDPENPQTHWNLGYLAMKTRDYDAAEKAFDEAAKRNSELWPGWLQVISALDRDDKIEEARARLDAKKAEADAAGKRERAQLARLCMRFDLIDRAVEIVKDFEQNGDPADPERWILLGWLALYANRYPSAEEFFRQAVILAPDNFEATNGLALALLDQRNREKIVQARSIAAKNYRANPDSAEAATTYAWTLFLSGAPQDSDALFQPMLQSGELSATAAYYLAEIANARGDLELAGNLLSLALSQNANFPKRTAAKELREMIEQKMEPEEDPVMKDFYDDVDFGADEEDEDDPMADAVAPEKKQPADANEKDAAPEK